MLWLLEVNALRHFYLLYVISFYLNERSSSLDNSKCWMHWLAASRIHPTSYVFSFHLNFKNQYFISLYRIYRVHANAFVVILESHEVKATYILCCMSNHICFCDRIDLVEPNNVVMYLRCISCEFLSNQWRLVHILINEVVINSFFLHVCGST